MTLGSGEKLLAILDLFDEGRPVWTPHQLIEALGYTRPTLYRYLKTLKEAGFLVSLPGGRVALGPRFVELDFLVRRSDPLIVLGQPVIEDIADRFPGTAFIVQWYGARLLCVASASRDAAARTSYPRGRPMPLNAGAASKVILAYLPRQRQIQILSRAHADGKAPDEDLLAELRAIRRAGFAIARGEVTPGIVGSAAPILDEARKPLGSLCVSMEEDEFEAIDAESLREAVIAGASAIGPSAPPAPGQPRKGTAT